LGDFLLDFDPNFLIYRIDLVEKVNVAKKRIFSEFSDKILKFLYNIQNVINLENI